jgi:hypothetical protein
MLYTNQFDAVDVENDASWKERTRIPAFETLIFSLSLGVKGNGILQKHA